MTWDDRRCGDSSAGPDGLPTVSVVVPACNEQGNVSVLAAELETVLAEEDHEIIFVDDGSTDGTLATVRELCETRPEVGFLSLSRNFGHQNAIKAGIDHARGDCVITIDADLQHPPQLIPEMLEKWREGYDVVNTIRRNGSTLPLFKRASSRFFYAVLNLVSEVRVEEGTADFRLLDRRVVDVLCGLNESGLFYRGLIPWTGFRTIGLPYSPRCRHAGKTKYSISRMLGFAVSGLVSFSVLPLRLATIVGWIMALGGFGIGIKAVIEYLFTRNTVPGWASTIVAVVFVGGIQLIMLGIIGEYVGRLFIQAKHRPHYIVRESRLARVPACR